MSGVILDQLKDYPVRRYAAGETVIEQGARHGVLCYLIEGKVEILKNGTRVTTASLPGVVFGDMSVLLDVPHTASVVALEPCSFHVVEDPLQFLLDNPAQHLHVSRLLARRLRAVTQYLVDVQQQYEGHDHIAMVGEVLEALMNRQPRKAS